MANGHNPAAGWQGGSGPEQGNTGGAAQSGPGDGEGNGQDEQYIELPEHQGVIIDYIPPKSGLRSEVGDPDPGGDAEDVQS